MGKAEQTRQRIIRQSAPVFNRKGFAGTTMSDILNVTGLTKGGIYGNFSGKDEIALEAFDYNKDQLFSELHKKVSGVESPVEQLHTFIRAHGLAVQRIDGGCPILNTAIDADDSHPELKKKAKAAVLVWINYLKNIISTGIQSGEIREQIDPERYARMFISMIQGAVFMGRLTSRPDAYLDVSDHIHRIIDVELKLN
jgi:TetR/AcrR family transcriptional regulator, transcriptional repressor for nem operon